VHYKPEDILKAECKIVDEIHGRLQQTKVLILGIFPRAMPYQNSVLAVNAGLAKLDDGGKTRYLDIGPKLGKEAFTPDAVHINAQGYQIWADAMQPTLQEMLR
jgi:lysophospholipase L1-like esterase